MNLEDFKGSYYLFDPMGFGKIFAFVDFGNVRPWAKDFWPEENAKRLSIEVDIKKLSEMCDWVKVERKFFYYGYYPDPTILNGKKRKAKEEDIKRYNNSIFRIDKAKDCGFTVKTKEMKMIPQYDEDGIYVGKLPKCNFDVEITMSLLTKINKYDSVMIFSGDSDFGGLLGYLKNKGKKIIVVCTRNRMSSELESVADKFVPAETLKEFLRYTPKQTHPSHKGLGGV